MPAISRFRILATAFYLAILSLLIPLLPASATESTVVFQRKAWEVRAVAFDDGSLACVAKVDDTGGGSLSLWYANSLGVKLVFFSPVWNFDQAQEDIAVRIDRRASWSLTNADLKDQSVFFTLSGQSSADKLLREIMNGYTLHLMTPRGDVVRSYTLAGSNASINALIQCAAALKNM